MHPDYTPKTSGFNLVQGTSKSQTSLLVSGLEEEISFAKDPIPITHPLHQTKDKATGKTNATQK